MTKPAAWHDEGYSSFRGPSVDLRHSHGKARNRAYKSVQVRLITLGDSCPLMLPSILLLTASRRESTFPHPYRLPKATN